MYLLYSFVKFVIYLPPSVQCRLPVAIIKIRVIMTRGLSVINISFDGISCGFDIQCLTAVVATRLSVIDVVAEISRTILSFCFMLYALHVQFIVFCY